MDRCIAAIYRAFLKWRNPQCTSNSQKSRGVGAAPIVDNISNPNDNVIQFPLIFQLHKHYLLPTTWSILEGKDKILTNILRAYNSSPLIPQEHRLQLRLQRLFVDSRVTGPAIDENDVARGPNLSYWQLDPGQLLPGEHHGW
jgi:hypothetical protein